MVFEDEYLLVVDKPAGLVTHPAAGLREPTLVHGLLARGLAGGVDPERPGVVHRLDRDTTGLLVLARDADVHATLSNMLRARSIEREYVTLVHGRPPSRRGTIDAPIGRDPRTSGRMAVDGRAPRHAVTHFELAEALARTSLLEVRLETGRTHQIRVHLAAIGHPGRRRSRVRARRPASSDSRGSSCTLRVSRSSIRSPVGASSSTRRCHATSWRRSSSRARSSNQL